MNEAPPPAEAATEVGQEEPNFYSAQYILEEVGKLVAWSLVIAAVVLVIAFVVGYFV